MDELVKDFLQESTENLDRLDQEFVHLESDPGNAELLGSIFRTIHTIKGSCGFLGFTKLEKLTHAGESLLSQAIGAISGIISQVNQISGTIAAAVEEQSATASEMSRNLTDAAKGSGEVAQNINGVAQAAQNTSQGATDSLKAAQQLAKMSTQLRGLVEQFKLEKNDLATRRSRGSGESSTRRQESNTTVDSHEEVYTR